MVTSQKTIFIDIDETLLNNDKILTNRTKDAIAGAIERGHKIILISGAAFPCHAPRFKDTKIEYIAGSNGGAIYRMKHGKLTEIIQESAMQHHLIIGLCQLTQGLWERIEIHTKETLYRPSTIEELRDCIQGKIITEFTPNGRDFDKMKLFGEVSKPFIKENNLYIANYAKPLQEIKFLNTGENKCLYYDIVNAGVSKANAIQKFCQLLKIDPDNTIAIGDGFNDIEMLKVAKTRVAMGNAVQALKDIADIIIDTNNNDGVAKFLDTL